MESVKTPGGKLEPIVLDHTHELAHILRSAADGRIITYEDRRRVREALGRYAPVVDEDTEGERTSALSTQITELQERYSTIVHVLQTPFRKLDPGGNPGRTTGWVLASEVIPSADTFEEVSKTHAIPVVVLTVEHYSVNKVQFDRQIYLRTIGGFKESVNTVDDLTRELLNLPAPLLEKLGLPTVIQKDGGEKCVYRYAYYDDLRAFGVASGLLARQV